MILAISMIESSYLWKQIVKSHLWMMIFSVDDNFLSNTCSYKIFTHKKVDMLFFWDSLKTSELKLVKKLGKS